MPSIIKREHINKKTNKKTVSYQVKVRVKGYPPETASFKKKTDADHWGQRVESEIREGKYFPNKKAKTYSVADLIDKYLADLKTHNPRRHDEVKPLLDWWKSELNNRALANFTAENVLDSRHKLLSRKKQRRGADGEYHTLTPATVNRYMTALHTALQFGIKPLKWIMTNPVSEINILEEPLGRIRFLSPDEINRLIAACRASRNVYLAEIVLIGLGTGARRDEIRQMKWQDVAANNSFITLPKTKNGEVRSVMLTGKIQEMVIKMREARGEELFLFPSPHDASRPIDFESAWRTALKHASVENFHFHDIRHTFASHLAMENASLLVIAEALGHKSLEMVKRYAHLTHGHTSSMVGKMTERVLGHVEI